MTNAERDRAIQLLEYYGEKLGCKAEFDFAIKALEEVKGLRLLVDWAVDCDFGYDNIPEEYEKYKEEISDMRYTEGLIYIAKKEAEGGA